MRLIKGPTLRTPARARLRRSCSNSAFTIPACYCKRRAFIGGIDAARLPGISAATNADSISDPAAVPTTAALLPPSTRSPDGLCDNVATAAQLLRSWCAWSAGACWCARVCPPDPRFYFFVRYIATTAASPTTSAHAIAPTSISRPKGAAGGMARRSVTLSRYSERRPRYS